MGLVLSPRVGAESPVENGKVLSGADGVRVAIIPVKPRSDGKALVSVSGTDSEFDGIAQLAEVEPRATGYTTQVRGRAFTIVGVRENRGNREYLLNLPGRRDGIRVSYDEKATQELSADEMYALYKKQEASGALARLRNFDRKSEEVTQEKQLADAIAKMNATCGATVVANIAWSSIPDEVLKTVSISSSCGTVIHSARGLCEWKAGRDAIHQVSTINCQFGAVLDLKLQDNTLTYTTFKAAPNQADFTKSALEQTLELSEKIRLERTTVCTDGKNHYVVLAPDEKLGRRLYWGDSKALVRVDTPAFLGAGWFFEPRAYNSKNNSDLRGYDLRVYSHVSTGKAPDGTPTCAVTCGQQETAMTVLGPEKASVVLGAQYADEASASSPEELLRDDQGNYYLLDKRVISESENYYRFFVGTKGKLKPLQVLNVVADSAGSTVFTSGGELHSEENAKTATWTAAKRTSTLTKVSVSENLRMIYKDLGVYNAKQLGNPCDVFLTR